MIRVLFRTCEKVNSLHGLPRPFGLTKRQTIEVCFKSLLFSLKKYGVGKFRLYIIADDISPELLSFFRLSTDSISPFVEIIEGKFGNDESLRKCFEVCKEFSDEDIVYFVEDDYLHTENTIEACMQVLSASDAFIHPTDYPNFYHPRHMMPTRIYSGNFCYWRHAPSLTFTFMARMSAIQRNYQFMLDCCTGADDILLSSLFGWDKENMVPTPTRKEQLLSPIPSLAAHFHETTLPFYLNWKKEAEKHLENGS